MDVEAEHIQSVDGTPIAFRRQGQGEPVLLVHGSCTSREFWAQVVPHLAHRFTIVAMDRRGRGASGDGEAYSLEFEIADIAAVIDALGGGVHLVGHSFGARLALDAAARASLRSLTLYEPAMAVEPGLPERLEAALARAGDRSSAVELFLSEGPATPDEVEALRSLPPVWERLTAAAPTLPRETRSLLATPLNLDAAQRIRVPVLLLVGERTDAPLFLDGLEALEDVLLDVRREVIPGQAHLAPAFAPETFAQQLASFLDSVGSGSPGTDVTVRAQVVRGPNSRPDDAEARARGDASRN